MKTKFLISIIGPTAIGKTSLSIKVAKHFGSEIISCDSRQFYKEMNIGTAVPSSQELAEIPHHFIQHKSVFEDYNVGSFEKDALTLMDHLFQKHDILILTGGSGLYQKAVLEGLDEFPDVNPSIRTRLNKIFKEEGLEKLKSRLKQLDPAYYKIADIENPHRIIRALEVSLGTNKPFSFYLNQKKVNRNFKSIKIGLTAKREIIYDRINKRVDLMIEEGLVEEVKHLYPYKHLNALKTVGYSELFDYLDGLISKDKAIEEIKKNTRRYAKRQLTWYRKQQDIEWFDSKVNPERIIKFIEEKI
jgi:tRNA dimethylallyltransferase